MTVVFDSTKQTKFDLSAFEDSPLESADFTMGDGHNRNETGTVCHGDVNFFSKNERFTVLISVN